MPAWLRTVLVAGTGFFTDAYDLFIVNMCVPMISCAYYFNGPQSKAGGCGKLINNDLTSKQLITAAAVTGTFFGQLIFGYLGDRFGRKSVYGLELIIIMLSTIMTSFSANTVHGINVIGMLFIFRFFLGFGIGGDYPVSSVVSAEFATTANRGRIVAAVFAQQGTGILTGAVFSMIVVAGFHDPLLNDATEADYMWRLLFGLGALPAAFAVYYRLTLPESPRYTANVLQKREQAAIDLRSYGITGEEVELTAITAGVPSSPSSAEGIIPEAGENALEHERRVKSHWSEFVAYFGQWKNFKVLFGTSMSWFLIDVAFYGTNLNQSSVLTQIGYTSTADAYQYFIDLAYGNAIIALLGTVPGYWFTVFFIERWGRKNIQLMGFAATTVIFTIMAASYKQLYENSTGGFVFLFTLSQFFMNFGANTTTFIIPAEVFPTKWRSTAHGISAACGKLGAIVSNYGLLYWAQLAQNSPPLSYQGPQAMLAVFAACSFLGIFTTLLIPEAAGKTLEELNEENSMNNSSGVSKLELNNLKSSSDSPVHKSAPDTKSIELAEQKAEAEGKENVQDTTADENGAVNIHFGN